MAMSLQAASEAVHDTIKQYPLWYLLQGVFIAVVGSGVVGILLAVYLWSNMAVTAAWVLGLLLRILLISEGLALTNLAGRFRIS